MKDFLLSGAGYALSTLALVLCMCSMMRELHDMNCEIGAIIMTQNHQFEVLKRELSIKDELPEQSCVSGGGPGIWLAGPSPSGGGGSGGAIVPFPFNRRQEVDIINKNINSNRSDND